MPTHPRFLPPELLTALQLEALFLIPERAQYLLRVSTVALLILHLISSRLIRICLRLGSLKSRPRNENLCQGDLRKCSQEELVERWEEERNPRQAGV